MRLLAVRRPPFLLAAVAAGAAAAGPAHAAGARGDAATRIATRPIACSGEPSATRDPARDAAVSPGGGGVRPDQHAAADVRRATLRIAPRALCLELRTRRAWPARVGVHVQLLQALTREDAADLGLPPPIPRGAQRSVGLRAELRDGRARAVEGREEGRPPERYRVAVSVAGRTLRVRFPARRATRWGFRLDRRFTWRATTTVLQGPARLQAYAVDDAGPVRVRGGS